MRGFEKISFEQFNKNIKDDKDLYKEYKIPERKTKDSAGYDFLAIEDINIKVGEVKKIPTGIKAYMNDNEVLFIVVRSSMGIKHGLRLCNQVGVVDSDYYNNEDNEGHIFVFLKNEGDRDVLIEKNKGYAQGIFLNYLTTGDEVNNKRSGGFGSTSKSEK